MPGASSFDIRGCWVRRGVEWLVGALLAVSVVYAVMELSQGGFAPQDAASVLGLPIGASGLLAAVVALRKQPEDNTANLARGWAATLADRVDAVESRAYNGRLGNDHVLIDLAFTHRPASVSGRAATAPSCGRLLLSSAVGGVPDVAAYWQRVQPQRLMVTGPAGAGKTVFAVALIRALIRDRAGTGTGPVPVPVRIPASRWGTDTDLDAFVTQCLVEVYRCPRDQASAMVEQGLVLPVLDGLDEMDPALPDGTPDPDAPRARAALKKLNIYRVKGSPGPVVVTCRTSHLEALTLRERQEATARGVLQEAVDGGPLREAAQVSIDPVSPDDAVAYLTARAQDPTRWQSLTGHLTAHPTGALATVLSTPWRLCLTATVYHDSGAPGELTAHATARTTTQDAEQALDDFLLARFIPAAARLHKGPGGHRAYDPGQIHRWLHHRFTLWAVCIRGFNSTITRRCSAS